MGEGPGVKIVTDFARKIFMGRKFEELRGSGGVRRSGGVAAGEHKDVTLGINGNAGGFAEINIWRKFQKIGDRVVANFRRLLGEKRSGHEKEQNKNGAFHAME